MYYLHSYYLLDIYYSIPFVAHNFSVCSNSSGFGTKKETNEKKNFWFSIPVFLNPLHPPPPHPTNTLIAQRLSRALQISPRLIEYHG